MDLRGIASKIAKGWVDVNMLPIKTYLYDKDRGGVFPNSPIRKMNEANKLPLGSKEQIQALDKVMTPMMMGLTSPVQSSRPSHQMLLEKAANSGDMKKVGEILDSIPANDPYKVSMERLFRKSVPQVKGAMTKIHPDDMDVMEKVIDYARLKQPYSHKTELMASDILENYPSAFNIKKQPKSMGQIANIFDKALQKLTNR